MTMLAVGAMQMAVVVESLITATDKVTYFTY